MKLANNEDVALVGVTDASVQETIAYRAEQELDFPILAGAGATRDAWGVSLIWGNVVRLVDPDGRVAAESLTAAAKVLGAR